MAGGFNAGALQMAAVTASPTPNGCQPRPSTPCCSWPPQYCGLLLCGQPDPRRPGAISRYCGVEAGFRPLTPPPSTFTSPGLLNDIHNDTPVLRASLRCLIGSRPAASVHNPW